MLATVTPNVHDVCRPPLSDAVQVTVVGPTGNAVPVAGVQATATGAAPPVLVAFWYVMGTGTPPIEDASTLAGHAIVNSGIGGGGGATGDPPQLAAKTSRKGVQPRVQRCAQSD